MFLEMIPPPPADAAGLVLWGLGTWGVVYVVDVLRYAIPAGVVVGVLWVLLRRRLGHRRIQAEFPARRHQRREILWSLATLGVFATMTVAIIAAHHAGLTQLYPDIADYGWGYLVMSLIGLVLAHDAWFYWTHRAMHHRRLFRLFHRVHHKSHNPSPWAACAFAPGEAVVQGLFLAILVFIVPLHPLAIGVFVLHQIVRNVLGHSGVELFPRGFATHPVGRFITTHTHHDLHHSKVTGNFGLYFTWWDRWMGTLRDDYETAFEDVTSRPRQTACAAPRPGRPGAPADTAPAARGTPIRPQAAATSTVAPATPAP